VEEYTAFITRTRAQRRTGCGLIAVWKRAPPAYASPRAKQRVYRTASCAANRGVLCTRVCCSERFGAPVERSNLDDLIAFLVVVRERSFTPAAKRKRMTEAPVKLTQSQPVGGIFVTDGDKLEVLCDWCRVSSGLVGGRLSNSVRAVP
jgi:hypothetical protein